MDILHIVTEKDAVALPGREPVECEGRVDRFSVVALCLAPRCSQQSQQRRTKQSISPHVLMGIRVVLAANESLFTVRMAVSKVGAQ